MIDWNDPAARARLIEQIGPEAYNRAHAAHIAQSTVKTVNGYAIRSVASRFGRLFQIQRRRDRFHPPCRSRGGSREAKA